jgi:RNA polymerase sigma-70 factor (TIGR02960 family)
VDQGTLDRARSGDADAFSTLTAPHERELLLHCYRMLGSLTDAEDLLQDTMLAAWRGLPAFEGRSSVRTWLYRIATNRCLNALRDGRRVPPEPVAPFAVPPPTRRGEVTWLQPYADSLLEGLPEHTPGPDARYETQEAVRLAFITALQRMPPRQAATLILRDVLGYPLRDVAAMLDTTETAAKGTLQRARAASPGASFPAPRRSPAREEGGAAGTPPG